VLARVSLLGLLVYVTLDLASPAVPGAFMFEVDESVESLQGARGRVITDLGTLPHRDGGWRAASSPPEINVGKVARPVELLKTHRRAYRLPRAALAAATAITASPLEDPH
jgi:hypothetical protein